MNKSKNYIASCVFISIAIVVYVKHNSNINIKPNVNIIVSCNFLNDTTIDNHIEIINHIIQKEK